MAVTAHKDIQGLQSTTQAMKALQTALSVTVNTSIDRQHMSAKVIALQNAVNALVPGAVQVSRYINDEDIPAKLIAIQKAIP